MPRLKENNLIIKYDSGATGRPGLGDFILYEYTLIFFEFSYIPLCNT